MRAVHLETARLPKLTEALQLYGRCLIKMLVKERGFQPAGLSFCHEASIPLLHVRSILAFLRTEVRAPSPTTSRCTPLRAA